MQRYQRYRFRLKTTPKLEQSFARFSGACRYVYNWALSVCEERRKTQEKRLNRFGLMKELTRKLTTPDVSWLKEVPRYCLNEALNCLESAYQNFFAGHKNAPRFKKKGKCRDGFQFAVENRYGNKVDSQRGNRFHL